MKQWLVGAELLGFTILICASATPCWGQVGETSTQRERVTASNERAVYSWEIEVFNTPDPEALDEIARQIEAAARRRKSSGIPGHTRLFRLAGAAYGRAGRRHDVERVCGIAASSAESPLEAAAAWQMNGQAREGRCGFAEAEAAYRAVIELTQSAGKDSGQLLYPALLGVTRSLRGQDSYQEAADEQLGFLEQYSDELDSNQRASLLRHIALDSYSAGDAETGDLWAGRLLSGFPSWGTDNGRRVLFQLDSAARGDRVRSRLSREYTRRVREIWEEQANRTSPVVLAAGVELATALDAGGQADQGKAVREEIIDMYLQRELEWRKTVGIKAPAWRTARIALYDTASRILLDGVKGSPDQDDVTGAAATLLVDLFPDTPLARRATDFLSGSNAIPSD